MNLDGQRVAFTGRLASMTRPEAARLVLARGGVFVPRVTHRTALLVVGQDGWPLQRDGTLSDALEAARGLQAAGNAIRIVQEEDFLRDLGVEEDSYGVHRRFTLPQLTRLLRIPRDRLRSWLRAGWLIPADTTDGVCSFDFQQVAAIRSVWHLLQAGVSAEKIRRSLEKLSTWLPVEQVRLLKQGGLLFVRLAHGLLADATGQLYFDFEVEEHSTPMQAEKPEKYREVGCALEAAGQFQEAMDAYRKALACFPDVIAHFNLGNILYRLGAISQAAEHFRRAVDLDPAFAEAWNNLGNALAEVGQPGEAVKALRHALTVRPGYADGHYNLADVLEESGRSAEARRHWKTYVALEPIGEWATYARTRLRSNSDH